MLQLGSQLLQECGAAGGQDESDPMFARADQPGSEAVGLIIQAPDGRIDTLDRLLAHPAPLPTEKATSLTVVVEVVMDRGMRGSEFLEGPYVPESCHRQCEYDLR